MHRNQSLTIATMQLINLFINIKVHNAFQADVVRSTAEHTKGRKMEISLSFPAQK